MINCHEIQTNTKENKDFENDALKKNSTAHVI